MIRRTGVTLLETLVAIFVMALGLIALLTLFPLGALNMAQAIKDDRTAQSSASAEGIANAWRIRQDPDSYPFNGATPDTNTAMINPGGTLPGIVPPGQPGYNGALWAGRSYPVYIDPVGWIQNGGNITTTAELPVPSPPYHWLATEPLFGYPGLPRRTARFLNNYATAPLAPPLTNLTPAQYGDPNLFALGPAYRNGQIWKACSLLDDIPFGPNGLPQSISIDFEGRYSWAFLVQMPTIGDPNHKVELTVVVYSGRNQTLSASGTATGERAYEAIFAQGSKQVQVRWNPAVQNTPSLRKGMWVMDGTLQNAAGIADPHGMFYRVVNVTDLGSVVGPGNGVTYRLMELELQHNAIVSSDPSLDAAGFNPGYWGRILVLDNVAEVFHKQ
jgi:hypothetical protein